MKGLAPLFLGIFGTFAFSWGGLTVIPNWQIGHLNPQSDEEGTDIYPQPQSGMFDRGARDYIFEQPVFLGKMRMGQDIANIGARAPAEQASPAPAGAAAPAASPSGGTSPAALSAPQGAAPVAASPAAKQSPSPSPATQAASPAPAGSPATASSPAPAAAASPVTSPGSSPPAGAPPPGPKTGLASPSPAAAANATPGGTTTVSSGAQSAGPPWPIQTIGEPPMYSAAWHHVHLYSPRSINFDSNMPAYRFLYKKRRIADARSADALKLTGSDTPPEGWEVIPSYDAKCLVAYLMALNQSHPLKEA